MTTFSRTIRVVLLSGLIAATPPLAAQVPAQGRAAGPTDTQVRALQQQIKSLQKQLDDMNATRDASTRQRLMQQNWQGFQDYLGQMHDRLGVGYSWSTGYPWMRIGPGMMSPGRTSWPLPKNLTAEQYTEQMRAQMKLMQEQMDEIAQTSDLEERQRLMQKHWQSTYQNMQAMRGMSWMWSGGPMMGPGMVQGEPMPSAKPLPDSDSTGARLVSTYCVQCHAAPQPTLHTAKEWAGVTQRMHIRMASGWRGIETPNDQEVKTVVAYMQTNARQ